jgi:hypothetical protein
VTDSICENYHIRAQAVKGPGKICEERAGGKGFSEKGQGRENFGKERKRRRKEAGIGRSQVAQVTSPVRRNSLSPAEEREGMRGTISVQPVPKLRRGNMGKNLICEH